MLDALVGHVNMLISGTVFSCSNFKKWYHDGCKQVTEAYLKKAMAFSWMPHWNEIKWINKLYSEIKSLQNKSISKAK